MRHHRTPNWHLRNVPYKKHSPTRLEVSHWRLKGQPLATESHPLVDVCKQNAPKVCGVRFRTMCVLHVAQSLASKRFPSASPSVEAEGSADFVEKLKDQLLWEVHFLRISVSQRDPVFLAFTNNHSRGNYRLFLICKDWSSMQFFL